MNSKIRRRALAAVGAVALIPSSLVVTASPAQAALGNCSYPWVCLYNASQTKVAQYKDVTTYFQDISRTDIAWLKNTRNDDVVYIRYTSGYTACVENNREADLRISGYGRVNGIRISSSDTCFR
ncbi:hypothetical protein [Micromonospora marina]|uniref:hypothetical protein n=1 Tax=Micromonospora marina TaxID=307120 RepID=UPI003453BFBC